jgi:hypothetical protein
MNGFDAIVLAEIRGFADGVEDEANVMDEMVGT